MLSKLLLIALTVGVACACDATPPADSLNNAPARPAAPGAIPAPPDVAAPPADAVTTASGIAYKILTPGKGTIHPTPTSTVTANYTGWTTKGEMFDSSVTRGEPLIIPLNRLIPGWVEGMQMMVVGEKRRFWIPGKLAYDGQAGSPQGMLVFDIELLDVK
jgi:peptidylprolyl isomerase